MVAREALSQLSDRSIDRVISPPQRSDSKFGKGKGVISSSDLPTVQSISTQPLASNSDRIDRNFDIRSSDLPTGRSIGTQSLESNLDRIDPRASDDLVIERGVDGDSLAKEIRRDRAAEVDGIPDGGVDDRSIGPPRKTHRLTPFSYRRDGAIVQLLDLPSKFARPSVVQGQIWGDVLPTESTFRSAKFKEELEGVFVEDITEQVLTVSSLPRLDRLQGSNQFGLNLEIVDPAAASTLRSPVLVIEQFMAASSSACEASIQEYLSTGQSSEKTVGANGAAVLDPIAED
ncbi:hypothetical protein F2Q70_00017348 [Brassica cretica]|uniref:Uncharacterized protein n=1 Tax=Brassica cretica TaxID=69181 RepID=A0A8S9L1R5_BRACR|nr:hypothetical protein F2Q70_00017348 [Brassica cretica]KAF2600092.1 hypothetical protein F2Q68_00010312 [Brassica cretica]